MEDDAPEAKNQSHATWIAVLAVAITCCALLFYVFATYLSAINNNLMAANQRLTTMEKNESQLLFEIQDPHHAMATNAPAPAAPNPPPAATPPAPPVSPSTTNSVTPPPASKTNVPELPAPTTH